MKKINFLKIPLALWGALILPLLISVGGLVYFYQHGTIWQDWLTFIVFYQISLFGLAVGSHRFFAHRSFRAPPWMETLLFMMGSTAFQFSPLFWASFHRKHHRYTDAEGDPHSPWVAPQKFSSRFRYWLHSHFLWAYGYDFDGVTLEYSKDWLSKPHIVWAHRFHQLWGVGFIFLAGVFEAFILLDLSGFLRGLFWGGLFRLMVLHNSLFMINSLFGHVWGTRPFVTDDRSVNNALMFPFVLGECWHNNHHAEPAQASMQAAWYHLDPHYWILKGLEKVGVVTHVR